MIQHHAFILFTGPEMSNTPSNLLQLEEVFLSTLHEKGRSHNTIKNYKTDLVCFNRYLEEEKKGIELKSFELSHVTSYGPYLEKKYKADNSKRRRVQTLRVFFDFLVEKGHYPTNPVRAILPSPKFLDIPRPTPFIDVKTLWTHLLDEERSNNPITRSIARRNQLIVLLIFGGGLKVSDLAHLKKDHLFIEKETRVMITQTDREPYTVPLPELFKTIYEKYLPDLKKLKDQSKLTFDEILFHANPYQIISGGISPRGLEIIFEEFRKKLMINLTPRSLRQACIFKWLHQKKKDSLIKEWLGLAPSYSLKPFKEHLMEYIYNEESLAEFYFHYEGKNYRKN